MTDHPTQSPPLRDETGRQIHCGDLLLSFHFTGARRKKYYLYHVAVLRAGQHAHVGWRCCKRQRKPTMPNPDKTRMPWNTGLGGLPQIFRIGDSVQVRQDSSAPSEWCWDWPGIKLRIVGTIIDEHNPGRVAYFVHADGDSCREHDPMAEDWLEAINDAKS